MNRKPRVLILNEFSQLCTGFSTYMYYVLPKLYESGKYEIAELATYVHELHPKIKDVPWKVYPNEPHPKNETERNQYTKNRLNQFGAFRFDQVCLDFKPDIVITIRDWWMDEWIEKSPYRKFFKWVTMPTVDGEPQKQEWIDTYKKADAVLTYSVWGGNLLRKQTGGKLDPVACASPGCDTKLFQPPENKSEAKKNLGLRPDALIIQTVMRNQPRKLYPDLFQAFNHYLNICKEKGNHDLAKNSFLYLHTTQPDVGWDLVEEIRKYKLSHKVLFTYMCDTCNSFYPSFYMGERCVCKACQNAVARLPNTSLALDRDDLNKVQQVADLYVQYSICEGWGMPINDAKACGVPVLAVDYSAMSEQCYNGGALPIDVLMFYQEPIQQTYQLRARPNNQHCAEQMYKVLSNDVYRKELSDEARKCAVEIYDWEKVAHVWEDVIDATEINQDIEKWSSPPKILPLIQPPNNLDNDQFVQWIFTHLLQEPERYHTADGRKMISMLNLGYEAILGEEGRPQRIPITRENILNHMYDTVKHRNLSEQSRYLALQDPATRPKFDVPFVEI